MKKGGIVKIHNGKIFRVATRKKIEKMLDRKE